MEGSSKISRNETAEILVGMHSQFERKAISELGLNLPEGFVITPFDVFVLSKFQDYSRGITVKSPTSKEIAYLLELEFKAMGHQIHVDRWSIDNYLIALRGHKPGLTVKEGTNQATVSDFPELRTRYNLAVTLDKYENFKTLPDYKRSIQWAVAKSIISGKNRYEIIDELNIHQSYIIDMMILDILEYEKLNQTRVTLKDQILNALSGYREMYDTKSQLIDQYEEMINNGKYFESLKSIIGNFVNISIAELWIEILENDKSAFLTHNSKYLKRAIKYFIEYGRGDANQRLREHKSIKSLGGSSIGLASFVVHTAFGLDLENYSVVNSIDLYYDTQTK